MKFLKKELNRRNFLKVGGLTAGSAILAACTGQQADDGGGEAPADDGGGEEEMEEEMEESSDAAPAEEAGEIVWWYGWGQLAPAVDTWIGWESFQEHIGNNTLTHKPSTSGEEFLTAFAAGEPPDGGSNTDYPGFWARGVAVPVDDMIAGSSIIDLSDTTPGFGESLRYDGQLIGVPAIESFLQWALNYNSEHVANAGLDPDSPPETWEDLLAWHEQLTIFDSAGNLEILGLDPVDAMGTEPDFHAFSQGHHWYNETEGTFHLDDPAMAAAISNIADFYRIAGPDNVGGLRSVEGQGTWGAAVEAGVQSMIIEGYWHPGEASINQPDIAAVNRANWAPVPASRAGTRLQATNAHYVQLYKDANNIDGMFKVAEFSLTNEALDTIFTEVGWLSNKLSHLDTIDADAFPGLRFYIESANQAEEWMIIRRSPIHWFVNDQWTELNEQVYRDLMSAEDAAAELQKRAVEEWEAQGLG
ncbi:MAG: substrate-binding domain-containing protein [Chloroflexota bacterium]